MSQALSSDVEAVMIAALYQFTRLDNPEQWREHLWNRCHPADITGTLLLANEGINGTIAGDPLVLGEFLKELQAEPAFASLSLKISYASKTPFRRLKIKVKREIVTMGVDDLDVNKGGEYVSPDEWNALISDPDVIVVDTRNEYEVDIGHFEGAVNPRTNHFRQMPQWLESNDSITPDTRVAMYCTGGIRCEKSTAYLRSLGVDQVYHLRGGILSYLEEVDEKDSLWRGECFVFDDRVSVNHDLEPGEYDVCYGCRRPLHPQDKLSEKYRKGVSCPGCHDGLTEDQKQRFAMRQAQADARGDDS